MKRLPLRIYHQVECDGVISYGALSSVVLKIHQQVVDASIRVFGDLLTIPHNIFGLRFGELSTLTTYPSPEETRLRCIKLFLDSDLQIPNYVSKVNMEKQMQRYGKTAQTVVAEYLTELFKHAKERLVKRYGEYFVKTTRIEVVLTVPAMWSDAAKDATLNAAKQAGMGPNIKMISEPEAAAVYTVQSIQPNHLRVGDNLIVCDAGGGTVDLISYEIKQLSPFR